MCICVFCYYIFLLNTRISGFPVKLGMTGGVGMTGRVGMTGGVLGMTSCCHSERSEESHGFCKDDGILRFTQNDRGVRVRFFSRFAPSE
jgi:hypothetical protein